MQSRSTTNSSMTFHDGDERGGGLWQLWCRHAAAASGSCGVGTQRRPLAAVVSARSGGKRPLPLP
eukprot:366253-Chlamydomonas_euryale.AAC.8